MFCPNELRCVPSSQVSPFSGPGWKHFSSSAKSLLDRLQKNLSCVLILEEAD